MTLQQNPLIFGADPLERLVAVEHVPGHEAEDEIRLFFRSGSGTEVKSDSFRPYLWLANPKLLNGSGLQAEMTTLQGGNPLAHLVFLRNWKDWQAAQKHLRLVTNRPPGSPDAPYFSLSDPVQQYLIQTGRTLFKGMNLGQLRRMQMDIETYTGPGFEFPNPERETDRIIAITMADETGWIEVLSGVELDEKKLIERWAALVRERDPDVLEGHNIFNFDLWYLMERAKLLGLKLKLGRDGSKPVTRSSRFSIAEQQVTYSRTSIFGRHIIDTYFLTQAYDVSHRALESFTLKDVARHFGVAPAGRTYIEGADISATFDRDPARLMAYARDDILETRAISDILSASYFTQCQILPFSYQNICVRGTGTKIDSLMLREYFRQGQAIPLPDATREFAGGYTDIFKRGVVRNVHHADVRSLYPSLMLKDRIGPRADELGSFLQLLAFLRDFRLDAKRRMQQSPSAQERNHLDALQTTFKILINSFYGYLGFSQGRFNDFDAAERIAAGGRKLLQHMLDWLREHGAEPVEIDTDGIYFVPPVFSGANTVEGFRESFSQSLPAGIDIEFDGVYVAMFSYKMKNYALLDGAGGITIKGAALKSRGLEPFQRNYLKEWLRLTLEGRDDAIRKLREEYRAAITDRTWPIRLLAKTETLQDAPSSYAAKIAGKERGRNAAYELALKSGRDYRAGDTISYYVAGARKSVSVFESARMVADWDPANRDENVPYYLGKLDALITKFDAMEDENNGQQEFSFGP